MDGYRFWIDEKYEFNCMWEWIVSTIGSLTYTESIAVTNRSHNQKFVYVALQSFYFDQKGSYAAGGSADT